MNLPPGYPTPEEIRSEEENRKWTPKSLHSLMSGLTLNQCIVQNVQPRTAMTPIPTAIGVALEKTFGSK